MSRTHVLQSPKQRFYLVCIVAATLVIGAGVLFFEGGSPDGEETAAAANEAVASLGAAVTTTDVEKGALWTSSKIVRNPFQASSRQQSPKTLPLDRVLRELSLIPSLTPGEQTDAKELALVLRWASFQPERACDYAYHAVLDGADESLLKEAVTSWARVEPASAARWAARIRSPLLRDLAVSTASGIWTTSNQAAALSALKSLPGSAARSSALSGMAGVSVRNPKQALDWAEKLPGPLRERTLQQLFGSWMRRNPLAAADWLSNQPLEVQLPLAGRLAGDWVRKDPQAALFWTRAVPTGTLTGPQLPPGTVQRRAMGAALDGFVSSDPEAAAAWMTTGTGKIFFSERVGSLASSWTSIDPEAAVAWVSTIPAGRERDTAVAAIASTWTRAAPSEALIWIQGIRRGADRNTALSSFSGAIAGIDPEAAAYSGTQITERQLREATLAQVISQWRRINPGAATQFVQTSNSAAFLRKKQ
jgi:hypothetical protein